MIAPLLLAMLLLGSASAAQAWNVACIEPSGEKCPDGYAKVRTPWDPDPQSEHRRLFERTLELSGIPAALRANFTLKVHTDDAPLAGEDGRSYLTIRPVRNGARKIELRELSVQAMSNLPDNSYTLWDWASGNELCPPDRGNADALDCHNYETHIGWLNANHMLPQSQRFYEHLHRLALDRAKECKAIQDALSPVGRVRFRRIVLGCEKEALVLEAVGQHYLQDSWSMGHMWERWGGVEIGDFGGNRALGFAIAAFTGTIHGAGAMIPLGAADDPMCGPHDDDNYVDDPDAEPREHPGVGDVYLEDFLFQANGPWAPQRRALFGCAVDGARAVYAKTARVHGPLLAANAAEIDGSRHVTDPTCWRQRATNEAIATGCGIHFGVYPNQVELVGPLLLVGGAGIAALLPLSLSAVVADVVGQVELLPAADALRFAADAAYACTLAAAHAAIPGIAEQTNLAEGGLPSLVGVRPNSFYARGNAFSTPLVPPSTYADPALPWELDATSDRAEKEALNLTFADAHAADRCRTFTETDLNVYRSEVALAQADGDPVVIEARCSQCAQLVAPHLRFGTTDAPDETREAFCALVAPGDSALVYTGQDPASFAGADPSFEALLAATRTYCGCGAVTVSIQPTAVTLAPGDTQQFAATVLGSSNVDVTWTATSGTVDQDGFYFAPDEPGIYTVTATSVEDPTRSASAIVTIASGSSGVTRTDNRGQASVTNPTCDPAFRRSPEGATAWNDTISCESTVPGSQASGVATTMFSETYVGDDLVAVTASSSTSATGTEDRLACASGEYILLFSVAETTGVSIHAQVDGQPDSSTFFFGGPSITINDRDGHASVDQTATLTPGQYGVIITTLGCDGQGTTPPSSGSFSLNLVFGP